MSKERITISVDPDLIAAGAAAVADGSAESMSAWVNEAMAEKAAKESRLAALGRFIAEFETIHGDLSEDEMVEQRRDDEAALEVSRSRIAKRRARR